MMNNNSPLLQEDGPIERSVTLLPPPSSIIRPAASLTILRPAALTRGEENKSKTTPTTTMINRRSRSGSINATTTTSRWEVSSTITEVPWYYALERTCITVDHPTSTKKGGGGGRRTCTSSSSSPQQGIADRLCNAFRLWNISAIYNNDPTRNNNGSETSSVMASARLVSSDHVQMNVNLFLDPKKVAGTRRTIVEVQRMSGCCLSFRRYYRAIIEVVHNGVGVGDDAEHVVVDDDTIALAAEAKCSRMGRTPTSFRLPVRKLSLLSADDSSISGGGGGGEDDDDDDEDGRKNLSTAMEEAHGLLRSDRLCANMLGLEYLSQITTTTAAVQRHSNDNNVDDVDKLAISVSRAILCGSGDIRDTILSFVVAGDVSERKNNSDDRSPYDAKYMDILRNLALRVLSNALAVVAREGSLGEVLEEEEKQKKRMGSFLNVIIPTLVDEMGQSCPHNACLSARCLRSIVSTSKTGRDLVLTRGGGGGDTTTMDDVIGRAKDVGYRSCVNLERECDRLQSALVVQQ